jgi:hypothetical protein
MDILYKMFFDETKKKFLEYTKPKNYFYNFVDKYLNKKNNKYSEIINKLLI